ncbi:hypothetical protein HMSSN036_79270 [Paenibacillus macerans]|nr:hypothetical protein HMSSN036_79270 [Paenibacillus macerans]
MNEQKLPAVAYFCMEYGLHSDFKMYAGGLGILAGDYIKGAKDYGARSSRSASSGNRATPISGSALTASLTIRLKTETMIFSKIPG